MANFRRLDRPMAERLMAALDQVQAELGRAAVVVRDIKDSELQRAALITLVEAGGHLYTEIVDELVREYPDLEKAPNLSEADRLSAIEAGKQAAWTIRESWKQR